MKLLISGTTGFIGKHLVRRLLDENHTVYAIVRPSSNLDSLEKKVKLYVFDDNMDNLISFMQKENFDGIIHLASSFLVQHTPENIKGLVDSNVLFSIMLLEASAKSRVPWFINTGTFWQHYKNKRYSPVNLYAATKQAFEDIAQYYIETSPINFVTIKLNDTFGPHDVRPKIFNLWLKISRTKETLDMSPGKQIVDISYIDNIIDGYMRLAQLLQNDTQRKLRGKSFAIRSKERMTLQKLARLFEKVTNTTLSINWGKDYRPREVMMPWDKGRTIPGWKPLVSLKDGIRKTFTEK